MLEDLHKGGVEWSDLAADDPAGLDVDLVEEVGEEASLRRWRGLVPGVDKVRRPRSRRLRRLRALELGDGLGLECAVVGEAGAIRRLVDIAPLEALAEPVDRLVYPRAAPARLLPLWRRCEGDFDISLVLDPLHEAAHQDAQVVVADAASPRIAPGLPGRHPGARQTRPGTGDS
ncbi:MAG TPA: hypothetical protein VEM94_00975 [Candidatus Dormibacteraeota bacterium]|nr:hypothetical protein [Candidatus Dormibacteraeota bacterium]